MPGAVPDALAWYSAHVPGPATDAFAWVVIALFAASALLEGRDREKARLVGAGAWVVAGAFWLLLFPHFAFVHKSYIEGVLTLVGGPASAYAGLLLFRGRDSLFVLSRAVAVMGVIYLPFETIPALTVAGTTYPAPREFLIETVAAQTGALIHLLGYDPTLVAGPETGYTSAYQFTTESGRALTFEIVLACTGLGSIAIFAGLIAAVRAPLRRKLRALAVAVPTIYVLNLLRTTFIGVVFGNQLMQWYVAEVLFLFGATDPHLVSFFLSDRVISQLLAVVALLGITYVVVRELPELLTVIEDVLYIATNEEYDLREELDLPAARPDGGERE